MANNNDGGYSSRKFILAMAGLLISSVLIWFGKLDGGNFVALNSLLGGAYMVTNAYIAKHTTQSPESHLSHHVRTNEHSEKDVEG